MAKNFKKSIGCIYIPEEIHVDFIVEDNRLEVMTFEIGNYIGN